MYPPSALIVAHSVACGLRCGYPAAAPLGPATQPCTRHAAAGRVALGLGGVLAHGPAWPGGPGAGTLQAGTLGRSAALQACAPPPGPAGPPWLVVHAHWGGAGWVALPPGHILPGQVGFWPGQIWGGWPSARSDLVGSDLGWVAQRQIRFGRIRCGVGLSLAWGHKSGQIWGGVGPPRGPVANLNTCNQADFFAAHPCMAATLATFVKQCWNHVCLATAAQKRPSNLLSGYLYFQ